jgi:hypothetical protein
MQEVDEEIHVQAGAFGFVVQTTMPTFNVVVGSYLWQVKRIWHPDLLMLRNNCT